MKSRTLVASLSAFAAAVVLVGCDGDLEGKRIDEPRPRTGPTVLVISDRSGSDLVVEFARPRVRVLLHGPEGSDEAVLVRVRFEGPGADRYFREATGYGADAEIPWSWDETRGRYEAGRPFAFAKALARAERVSLELGISEKERAALVFSLPESTRADLAARIEVATSGDGRLERPGGRDPLEVELEGGDLFSLYEKYLEVEETLTHDQVLPIQSEEDRKALEAVRDPVRPVSSTFRFYEDLHPAAVDRVEEIAIAEGFTSLEQFTSIGDRVQIGMIAVALDRRQPGHLRDTRAIGPAALEKLEPQRRKYCEAVQAFRDEEIAWFTAKSDRFAEAVGERKR